jgi:thiamine biosynthesis lipoprotein
MTASIRIEQRGKQVLAACFSAMASPCELLVETGDAALARELGGLAAAEAWRIEAKYSRYRDDSVLAAINRSEGRPVEIDAETVGLMQFAAQCHELSGGAFDITSGVLRQAWRFDGSGSFPSPEQVAGLLQQVGFGKLGFEPPWLVVPAGMELDFGGIGKEYAVDRALGLVQQRFAGAVLVNFGGDLAANRAPLAGPWQVGVERPDSERSARLLLDVTRGGLATSGDTHRYFEHGGERYGHILDVRTGYPVRQAPRSVTVAAGSCVEAGLLSTLGMLQGAGAEAFLEGQGVRYWCLR